jgi:5-methyltetrahydrofolate--homocysteine methyltransferase
VPPDHKLRTANEELASTLEMRSQGGEEELVERMPNKLESLLSEKDVVLADGAMGTSLFSLGLANGAAGELWNVHHPEKVASVHAGFVDAGSDIILTNSFGGNRCRLAFHDAADRVGEINAAAARVAQEAASRANRFVVVAGSMGPTGEILEPHGSFRQADATAAFAEQAAALKDGGVDCAWIETMFSAEELTAAVEAVEAVGLPYVLTMTFDSSGRTMMGIRPSDALTMSKAKSWRPVAFGANCGIGPAQLLDSVIGLASAADGSDVIVAKGNCGTPTMGADMLPHYDGTPEIMADYACLARDAGARIIGGCCGTTPGHIRAMRVALETRARGGKPSHAEIERRLGPVRNTVAVETGSTPSPERRRRSRAS